jgi:uncharacterized Zn finger protein (UPF0148 family)
MKRAERNECLWCATPMVRTDGFPLCSRCQEKAKKMYYQARSGDNPYPIKKRMTLKPVQDKNAVIAKIQKVR